MKQILFVALLMVACVSTASAQLDRPVTRNFATAAGPTAAFDTVQINTVPLTRIMLSIVNHSGTDSLDVFIDRGDTTYATRRIRLGPIGSGKSTYTTPRPIYCKTIMVKGTAAGVKYSLIAQ